MEFDSLFTTWTIRLFFFFLPWIPHSKNSASAAFPELATRDRSRPVSVTAAARAEAAAASRRAFVDAEGIVEF